jgi:RNA polymerase sigma factor (sigma-70 family)
LDSFNGDRTPSSGQALLAEFTQYGRERPFEEIVRRYAGMVYTVCFRVTKDKHDAEDATQAVFLTLALHAKKQGAEIKALGPWLQQVAKRLALDMRRSKHRRKNREERHHGEETTRRNNSNGNHLPPADMDEIKAVLHDELQKLPSKYRLPLVLHYFGGLSRDEMAEELGCKPSTLGVRIFRGRAMLAGRLTGRGINFTPAMLPLALGFTVKTAVSQAMVASTSHAAVAAFAGRDLISLVSARVLGLTRRSAAAATIGKLKFAAAAVAMIFMSLGVGARAFGMLPKINIEEIISNQIHRLMRPLLSPISVPLRADAEPVHSSPIAQPAIQYAVNNPIPQPRVLAAVKHTSAPVVVASTPPVLATAVSSSFEMPLTVRSGALPTGPSPAVASVLPAHVAASSDTAAPLVAAVDTGASVSHDNGSAGGSGPATETNAGYRPTDATLSKTAYASTAGGTGGGGGGSSGAAVGGASTFAAANNLSLTPSLSNAVAVGPTVVYIPSSHGIKTILMPSSSSTKNGSPKPAATPVVRVPTESGLVTESPGAISGYGTVPNTGTLDINGNKIIADGGDVDRTLSFPSLGSISDVAPTISADVATAETAMVFAGTVSNAPANSTAGWYATNHGRLTLAMHPAAAGGSLVWGEDPTSPSLNLVNSVRVRPLAGGNSPSGIPMALSLVSPDRQDLPDLTGMDGQPIGIWQVGSGELGLIACADLTVHYDSSLATTLDPDQSDIQLWDYSASAWSQVPPSSFSLDTADSLVSGVATDFNYFAVTVPEPDSSVVSAFSALPSEQITNGQTVPEPVGLSLLTTAALLLGRRGRRGKFGKKYFSEN